MTTNDGLRLRWVVLASVLALSPMTRAEEPDAAWQADAPGTAAPAHNFDLPTGRCHAQLLAGVLGGALGGFVGSRIGKGDGRSAAVAVGSVLGYFLGSALGRGFDQMDDACAGEAAEWAHSEGTVAG